MPWPGISVMSQPIISTFLISSAVAAGVLFRLGDLNGKEGMGWKLGPVWASAAMALSSVSVVVSSISVLDSRA